MATPALTGMGEGVRFTFSDDQEVSIVPYEGSPDGALTAEQGSLCQDITNADLYINTDGATAWSKYELPISGEETVSATDVELDSFLLAAGDFVQWMVTAQGVTEDDRRYSCMVYANHDGTAVVRVQVVPILRTRGAKRLDLDISVDIASDGEMALFVNSDTSGGADVKWQRVHLL